VTSTFAAPVGRGRHRLGRAGLVHVATFVKVVHRGLFTSWRHPAKHRAYVAPRPSTAVPAPAPAL
jgi:hypothetical protein